MSNWFTDNQTKIRVGVQIHPKDIVQSEGETSMSKNWIQGAIKHPGALHAELGIPKGQKIPAKTLAAAAKKGGKLGRRARLAQTLKGLNHSGGSHYPTPVKYG